MQSFSLTQEGTIERKGVPKTEQLAFYLVDTAAVSDDLLASKKCDIYMVAYSADGPLKGTVHSKGVEVDPQGYGIGKFLVSGNFGPCELVLAQLSDGNFALYHCLDSLASSGMGKQFLNAIKDKATHLYIFEKEDPRYARHGATLHLDILSELNNSGVEVTCFKVSEYDSVVIDAEIGQVYLTKNPLIKKPVNEAKASEVTPITTVKTIQQSEDFIRAILKSNPSDAALGNGIYIVKIRRELGIPEPQKVQVVDRPTDGIHFDEIKPEEINPEDNKQENKKPVDIKSDIIIIIKAETAHLTRKTVLGCFPAFNAASKAKEIDNAVARASQKFGTLTVDKIDEFLNYKADPKAKSIKEALEATRYGKASNMFKHVSDQIEQRKRLLTPQSLHP